MSRLIFFFKEAIRALRRNGAPTMAAVVTTVVTVVLLGVLIPVFQTAQGKSSEIRDELNFQAEVYADATKAEIADLREKLLALPHVSEVEFITKETALKELRGDLDAERRELLAELKSNPLPQSFRVFPDDPVNMPGIEAAVISTPDGEPAPKPEEVDGPVERISPIVAGLFDRNASTQQIEQVTGALKIILTVITGLLVLASLMLVSNTIRLSIYTRRREVEVMRLVGATRWFIRWPFMIEGVIVGFAGGLVAILLLWLGKITVVDPLSNDIGLVRAQDNVGFPALVAILFAASILVSTIGSGVTLRRFLKV